MVGAAFFFFFSSRRRHTRLVSDWSSDVCSSDLIEVIRGPASVLYGSDALGGVVNVVQKDLPDASGIPAFVHGTASAGFESGNSLKDGSFDLEGGSGRVGFRGNLSGRSSGAVPTPAYTGRTNSLASVG